MVISLKAENKEKRTNEEQDVITVSQGISPFTILTWKYLLVCRVRLVLGWTLTSTLVNNTQGQTVIIAVLLIILEYLSDLQHYCVG